MRRLGGRQKGTPNKRTQALLDLIDSECPGYDPVVAMAKIANDPSQDETLRVQCHKEVAQYIHAKRKAIEVEADVNLDAEVTKIERVITDPSNTNS